MSGTLAADGHNLVSLCEFRGRSGTEGRVDKSDAAYPALADLMDVVDRELAGDGLLVLWHEPEQEPRFLFESGVCQPESENERHMILAATAAATLSEPGFPTRWVSQDDTSNSAMLATRIDAGTGAATLVSIHRRGSDTLRTRVREASTRMFPFVQAFFQLWIQRQALVSRLHALSAAVTVIDTGMIVVDGEGTVVYVNAAAETLIAQKDGVRRAGRMLSATRLADTLRLHAAIEHVINIDDADRSSVAAPVVALHRKNLRPLLAGILPVDAAFGGDAAAIVTLYDPEQDLDGMIAPVCKLYGLSPVETRLACLLAKGNALIDAATAMRVQEQTARSYLKQLFIKTDTNRQAELVWLLLKSAVRVAPGVRTRFL